MRRQAAAGGPADLRGLEAAVLGDAAADVEDDLAERGAHRHLDQAGVVHPAGQGEDLRARCSLGVPMARYQSLAVGQDQRHVGERLHVVDAGGLAQVALLHRERRPGLGHAAMAFQRGDQGALLAADERAGAHADLDVEVEPAAQDVLAQQAALPRLLDGDAVTCSTAMGYSART